MSSDSNNESLGEIKREEGGEVPGGRRLLTIDETCSPGVNRLWSTVEDTSGIPADEAPCCSSTLLGLGAPTPSRTWTALGAPESSRTRQEKRLNPNAAVFVPGVTDHIIADKISELAYYSPWSIIGCPQNISCGPRYDSIWRESSLQLQLPHSSPAQDMIIAEPTQPPQNVNVEVSRDKVKPMITKRPKGNKQKQEQEPEDEVEEEQEPPKPTKDKKKLLKIPAGLKRSCSLM
ncbi:uncharacterized protein LOC111078105 [Drosophila obscura]|uniref:uncharacterized protein LOC111078105 n=1 Tax=Drosophila obscura TaxID=7282 RepID=UPI001BB139BB|nr:uncharacterized protein LOC111078105 [Drosophila obscura]